MKKSTSRFLIAINFLAVTLFLAPLRANAEDTDIIIIGWIDHFTYGAPFSAVGAGIGVGEYIGTLTRTGRTPEIGLDSTGQQIKIEGSVSPLSSSYSTGFLHHAPSQGQNSQTDAHEAAHAKQVALIGPLQLPLLGLSYLSARGRGGPVEDWADAWRDLGSTMVNKKRLQIKMGVRREDDVESRELRLSLDPIERSSRVAGQDRQHGDYYRLRQAYLPLGFRTARPTTISSPSPECSSPQGSTVLEGGLLKRDFDMRMALMTKFAAAMIDSKQNVGNVSVDIERKNVDVDFLSQVVGAGIQAGHPSSISIELTARGKGALTGVWDYKNTIRRKPGVIAVAGYEGEARLYILDAIQLFARREKDIGTKGYERTSDTIGIASTPNFKAPDDEHGNSSNTPESSPVSIFGSIEASDQKETFQMKDGTAKTINIKLILLTAGTRF
jgi:hypothetical protein